MKTEFKDNNNNNNNSNKYTNLLTFTSNSFSLAYFTQKKLSGYRSDDIYKKGQHRLPPWHRN